MVAAMFDTDITEVAVPTLSPDQPTQTYETDITYSTPATNADFLAAVFGDVGVERPFVLGFAGKPKERKAWGGNAYQPGKTCTSNADLNWYYTLAVFHPSDGYHRRENACAAVFGVMLDDIGTKALPLARLDACPPSYVIETSPGNYQAGYLFDKPQADLKRVKALNQATVDAGLCDPGAKSPTTRWGRLPFASNGKTAPPFPCRLVAWHPERRYSIDQIIDGLELTPPAQNAPKKKDQKLTTEAPAEAVDRNTTDDVHIPRASENPVIAALKQRGLYKQPLGSGKHDITCPWVHEHTDGIDHGTAYFEPSNLYPIGGFKCQHGHGDHLRIGALLEELDVGVRAAKHKPTIKTTAGELHRIANTAEAELAATDRYYQRGGLIVSVLTDPETGATQIKPITQNGLLRALAGVAVWTRYDARTGADVECDPPSRHVSVVFDAERYEHLPPLAGLARQPHFRRDGSLVIEAGFDPSTGMYGVFDARAFGVPTGPTRQQAADALEEIVQLLSEFEFNSSTDLSAALAGILTATVRSSLATAPMFHIKAPQIASGKSYLSSIIAAFATPNSVSATGFPASDEECQKQLLALLLEAPGVVMYDNLTTDLLPHKALCSALTEEHLTGRILGVSKTATVGTRALFLSSGNNVEPVRDMTRRTVVITLDPKVETPASRQFIGNPLGAVRAERSRFVSLALTVITAWFNAGKPKTPCKPLNSFEQWSEWVRQPLMWLGQADPVQKVFEVMSHDPDRETLGRLLHAWRSAFGKVPTMIREAVSTAEIAGNGELREAMCDVAEESGEINRRRLGKWIARHAGRIVDGMRFVKASGTTSAERWRIEHIVDSVSSVKSVSIPGVAQTVSRNAASSEAERDADEDAEVF
jgi:hypothetical protein